MFSFTRKVEKQEMIHTCTKHMESVAWRTQDFFQGGGGLTLHTWIDKRVLEKGGGGG